MTDVPGGSPDTGYQYWIDRSIDSLHKEKRRLADEYADRAISSTPSRYGLWQLKIMTCQRPGKVKEWDWYVSLMKFIGHYVRTNGYSPDPSVQAVFLNGLVAWYDKKDAGRAAESFRKVMEADFLPDTVREMLPVYFEELGLPDEARTCGVMAFEARLKRYTAAGFGSVLSGLERDTELFRILWQACGYHDEKQYRRAAEKYGEAVLMNSGIADLWKNMGVCLGCTDQSDKAIACFDRALSIDPGSVAVLKNKGHILRSLGRLQEACDCFSRVLRIDPSDSGALDDLVTIRDRLGKKSG